MNEPQPFQHHLLLNPGPYFSVPRTLLECVVAEVGEDRFDSDMLEIEFTVSDRCQDHASDVGFWLGQPISYPLLRPYGELMCDFLIQGMSEWGKIESEARAILELAGKRLNWVAEVRRGYCGWLMTNRAFLDEHRQIFEQWEDWITENGIPTMGPVVRDAGAVPEAVLAEGDAERYLREFEEFFIRWRLDGMAAPLLPQPMGVHLPVLDLRPVLGHMRQGGTTFFIPDICPVPSRDKLRELIEEALRSPRGPDYLAEWFEIVHSDNVAKNQIHRYARIFEVQHYMRALYARHEKALQRKKSALMFAFATFFNVGEDSIERDLALVTGRLGPTWYLPSA